MAVPLLLRGGRIPALKAVFLEARVFRELSSTVLLSTESKKSEGGIQSSPKEQSAPKEHKLAPEWTVITTYKNLQHHGYNTYTFLDLNLDLSKFRMPQPSSGRESPRH
ncbi:NADH dehydrogenase [ubiquinone] flavoprotein 3, mitochondrial isoform X2 [Cricetulus griseus]|uniref:NADH dehydrogenase [ubiquinone] flavoprotein 3, mitochondrial n=1 Tax=Cricetulus griseus TaxID=10029 RepID=A0A9J7J8M4_CRIGR|nr:NADH dehydrogenase [ubiquinone] flavoprotein 3, mitochondrial isoform X2 [Cricetulus griseus]XP_027250185.1 NADH dehydrogenase [ubiquinone] flavoprotein 3, mitochondrial isoform X2 [Cricetulus griseus]